MRISSGDLMKQLLDTGYIDAELKNLTYDQISHKVKLNYGDQLDNSSDNTVIFKDCFSALTEKVLQFKQIIKIDKIKNFFIKFTPSWYFR